MGDVGSSGRSSAALSAANWNPRDSNTAARSSPRGPGARQDVLRPPGDVRAQPRRHQGTYEITTGVDKNGRLLGVRCNFLLDGGAYTSLGIATAYYAGGSSDADL
jgi:hypothetical protein